MLSHAEKFAEKISETYKSEVSDKVFGYDLFSKLVNLCRNEIIKTLSVNHKSLFEKLPIVVVTAPDVDATLMPVPEHEKEFIMVVSVRYFLSLHLILNANIWAALNSGLTDQKTLSEMSNMLCQLFAYRFIKRPLDRLPQYSTSSPVDKDSGLASDIIYKFAIVCFVIGHEFAHLLSQQGDQGINTLTNELNSFRLDIPNQSQKQELVADLFGAHLMRDTMKHFLINNSADSNLGIVGSIPFVVVSYLSAMCYLMTLCEMAAKKMRVDSVKGQLSPGQLEQLKFYDELSNYPVGDLRFESLMKGFGKELSNIAVQFADFSKKFWINSLYNASNEDMSVLNKCIGLLSVFNEEIS
ncbi:MAG: hypothetical protein AAB116_14950 [Candidatus Poribacteria bacterium]